MDATGKYGCSSAASRLRSGGHLSKLYVFGGIGTSGHLSTVEVYDPASDSWAQVSSLTSARIGMVAVAL